MRTPEFEDLGRWQFVLKERPQPVRASFGQVQPGALGDRRVPEALHLVTYEIVVPVKASLILADKQVLGVGHPSCNQSPATRASKIVLRKRPQRLIAAPAPGDMAHRSLHERACRPLLRPPSGVTSKLAFDTAWPKSHRGRLRRWAVPVQPFLSRCMCQIPIGGRYRHNHPAAARLAGTSS